MVKKLSKGMVQIYTGDGKGKTTAALGLALRASGQGMRVVFIQFVKGIRTGEHRFVDRFHPFQIIQISEGDCFNKDSKELEKEAKETIDFVKEQLVSDKYDIVILDEIFIASHLNLISTEDIIKLIDAKPASVELIMTGRDAPPEIIQRADLVTEMRMIKHPFNEGIMGRRGIEF